VRIRLDLDEETTEQLIKSAASERRPVPWEAEVLLRRALGLPFPRVAQTATDPGKKPVLEEAP
jgi:hypothetical protein